MDKTKILIVEDETIVAMDIKKTLKKLDYEVSDVVNNFTDALRCVKENAPDIILMDINLENSKDGIEIAIEIQKTKNIPIIYLTAFSDDATISRAVKTNPIAYMQKPFKREDIKSTLALAIYKINLSAKETQDSHLKHLGFGYYYDLKKENLYFKKLPIKLSVKEKLLLTTLAKADGQLVSLEKLEYLLWQGNPVSESSLRTTIYRLRNKLEHKIIETVPSFGIKLIKQ